MGTRIEPTISSHANDGLAGGDALHDQLAGDNALAAVPPGTADASADPTLEELAALENEVDNWLHPPARVAPEPVAAATPQVDVPPPPAAPAARAPAAPRKKRSGAWWALGVAAVAAAVGIAMFVNEPGQPEMAIEPVASTPAPAGAVAAPALTPGPEPAATSAVPPAPAPAPASRPEMVFLDEPAPAGAKAASPVAPPPEADPIPDAPDADTPDGTTAALTEAPVRAKKTAAPKEARASRRPPAEPEVARRSQTWPGDRRASDAARVDAAMAKCRAESADPGACNIRVCDVLGSSHPACR